MTDEAIPKKVETLIIGAGQAGLVMSEQLSLRGRPHLILERARIAERWRSERWDGLRSLGPNWATYLGTTAYETDDPHGYATRDEIVDFIAGYADAINAPVRCGVTVTALAAGSEGSRFRLDTSQGPYEADHVVVATGPFQRPVMPDASAIPSDILGLHASAYRNPGQLPAGAVLVVGAGASGLQIADELLRAGRRVFLSVGRHIRLPRRYRGKDQVWWRMQMGNWFDPVDRRGPYQGSLAVTGAHGGYTVDFRDFAARGAVLLGRLAALEGPVACFAPDLAASLAGGDASFMAFLDAADAHAARASLDLPEEPGAHRLPPEPAGPSNTMDRLDLRDAGIAAIIFATGYALDFGWIDMPVLDAAGTPRHRRGVTDIPGLYFLGLSWLSQRNSAFFNGAGGDAAHLADHIQMDRRALQPCPARRL